MADRGVGVTLICPGPVATGAPGQPRVTFGATLNSSLLAADKGKGAAAAEPAAPAGKEEKHRMTARLPPGSPPPPHCLTNPACSQLLPPTRPATRFGLFSPTQVPRAAELIVTASAAGLQARRRQPVLATSKPAWHLLLGVRNPPPAQLTHLWGVPAPASIPLLLPTGGVARPAPGAARRVPEPVFPFTWCAKETSAKRRRGCFVGTALWVCCSEVLRRPYG